MKDQAVASRCLRWEFCPWGRIGKPWGSAQEERSWSSCLEGSKWPGAKNPPGKNVINIIIITIIIIAIIITVVAIITIVVILIIMIIWQYHTIWCDSIARMQLVHWKEEEAHFGCRHRSLVTPGTQETEELKDRSVVDSKVRWVQPATTPKRMP